MPPPRYWKVFAAITDGQHPIACTHVSKSNSFKIRPILPHEARYDKLWRIAKFGTTRRSKFAYWQNEEREKRKVKMDRVEVTKEGKEDGEGEKEQEKRMRQWFKSLNSALTKVFVKLIRATEIVVKLPSAAWITIFGKLIIARQAVPVKKTLVTTSRFCQLKITFANACDD